MPTEDKLQYAFTAGEVSSFYANRSDLTKYDLGLLECTNFTVDPRGGIVSRVGSEFIGPFYGNRDMGKLVKFRGTVTDLLLVFGNRFMMVIKDGLYVAEPQQSGCMVSDTNPAVVTHPSAHGYSNGDWVRFVFAPEEPYLNRRIFRVDNATATTYEIAEPGYDSVDGTGFNTAAVFTAERLYKRFVPYYHEDLAVLNVEQDKNEVRLTHPDFAHRVLTYNADDDWDLDEVGSVEILSPPTGVTLTSSGTATTGLAVAVTAVDASGNESVAGPPVLITNAVDHSSTAGYLDIECSRVSGAVRYNFYRSLFFSGGDVHKGVELGYIGTSRAPLFRDSNITPDFTKSIPQRVNPFAEGGVFSIELTGGGTGYSPDDTISVSGGDGNFSGYPVVKASTGEILSVVITNSGTGYTDASVVTVDAPTSGTGAAFEITTTPQTGVSPSLFKTHQQRGIYFGSNNLPTTFWASRSTLPDLYDRSTLIQADDPYTFSIDSQVVKPIKHVVSLRNGLLIFTAEGVTQLRSEQGKAITGASAVAEPQIYVTVSETPPLVYNLDVLFLTEGSETLYAMLYTEYTESFKLQELSILASHLIGKGQEVLKMVTTSLPANLIYMPRADGRELTLTYLREQDVFAFARHETQGKYLNTEVISENGQFVKYQMVRRHLRGSWLTCIERVPIRDDTHPENYWGVDCGVARLREMPAAEIYADNFTGETSIHVDNAIFNPVAVGRVIFHAGGRFKITGYVSATELTGIWERDATKTIPQSDKTFTLTEAEGEWEITTPQQVITGLHYLEGEKVSVNADGDAFLDVEVVNGQIDLGRPYAKVYIGLPYTCRFKSLPVLSSQLNTNGKPSRLYTVFPRLKSSRGMEFGTSFDNLQEMKDRTDEFWGDTLALRSDVSELLMEDSFKLEQHLVGQQRYPLPATVLGYTAEYDWGDSDQGG